MSRDPEQAGADAVAWLSAARVKAYTSSLQPPLSWRTVERYARHGLVCRPRSPGRGRGRGRNYRWPPAVLHHLDTIRAALGPGPRGQNLALVRHRLWWDGGRPDLFEGWRSDRLREAAVDFRGEEHDRALVDLEGRVEDVSAQWNSRKWPHRARMCGVTTREALADSIIKLKLGRADQLMLVNSVYDGGPTYGEVLEHSMGLSAARLAGRLPGAPGEFVPDFLASVIPPPVERVVALVGVTAPAAAWFRDRLVECEGPANEAGGRRGSLRDSPGLAGMLLAALAARMRKVANLSPETVECPACSMGFTASPDATEVVCPRCEATYVVLTRWPI